MSKEEFLAYCLAASFFVVPAVLIGGATYILTGNAKAAVILGVVAGALFIGGMWFIAKQFGID